MGDERQSRLPWEEAYSGFWDNFESCFKSTPTLVRAKSYVRGLLGTMERKNSWQLAEFIGENEPYGLQQMLYRAVWDVELLRDNLVMSAKNYLLKPDERGVLIVDETGFIKKGIHSAGVKRQYSGTAGKKENCQIGVFLALAGSKGRALIDRALYLPKDWCDDSERMKAAMIPEEVKFHTKQELAQTMLGRAFSLGLKPEWVLADAAYGSDSKFRAFLRSHACQYVVAIKSDQRIWHELKQVRVDKYVQQLPKTNWGRYSAGTGSKGERLYEWLGERLGKADENGLCRYLLCRKKGQNEEVEYAYYFCYAPEDIKIEELAEAAGKRWNIECCFETAKQEVGLDEYEVRSWQGWHRHITLSMVGMLLLCLFKSLGLPEASGKKR